MAGVDGGFRGKGKDLFLDSGEEEFTAATGEIPATDTMGKEDVPAEKLVSFWQVEAKATWAVPWNVEKFGLGPSGRGRSFFLEELGGGDGLKFLGETEEEHGVGVEAEGGGLGMVVDGASGPGGEGGGVPDMVPVTVREQEGVGLEFFCLEKIEKAFGGIDGEEMAVKVEKVGVGRGEATGESEGLVHGVVGEEQSRLGGGGKASPGGKGGGAPRTPGKRWWGRGRAEAWRRGGGGIESRAW